MLRNSSNKTTKAFLYVTNQTNNYIDIFRQSLLTKPPLSDRTFQRKLKEEGLSFRKITNEVKSELSTYLSKRNKMKTQDIAHIFGYSEPSAYLHAVKRWDN